MNKLSKQKRTQLIAAALLTLLLVVGLYFGLIRHQLDSLNRLGVKKDEKQANLTRIRETKSNSKQIEADLLVVSNLLQRKEEDMASGDLYSTMITLISTFKQPYQVYIPQFTSGGMASDVNLLPKFPYKQVTVTIGGTAYYSDLGQFLAGFENRFPSSRVLNLELTPATSQAPEDKEKLQFKMDIVSLVKPTGTHLAGKR